MSQPFGQYQLLELIGSGSLGEVFRAADAEGREWALKRLLAERARDAALRTVFESELAIAQNLQHPRLVGARDSGEHGGWPYYVMSLMRRGTVAEQLEHGPLPPASLEALLLGLGEALEALGEAGYLHCDLSPRNLMWDEDRLHLGDFGSATPVGQAQAQPRGTYAYMSPEQVRNEPLDQRSQLFSAAALLWHCATGTSPFARPAQHLVFMAVVNDEPPAFGPGPGGWEEPLRLALRKEPDARGIGLSELVRHLLEAL